MIYDARTSKIVARARQHRADVLGDFMKTHPVHVVLVLALGAVVMTIGHSFTTDVTTASNQAEVTHVGVR